MGKNGISYIWWCKVWGFCKGGVDPDVPNVRLMGTPVNVETAGVQVAAIEINAPNPGEHFMVRRAGIMKSDAYVWTNSPAVSMGIVSPWTDLIPNRNLQVTAGYGTISVQPEFVALEDGDIVYVSVNNSGSNGLGTASVYPFLIGFWHQISTC